MIAAQEAKITAYWHRSIFLLFVFLGAGFTSISTRMPLVKSSLGVTATQLGLILLSQGLGALVGLNLTGRLIIKTGTRIWIRVGYPALGINVALGALFLGLHLNLLYICNAVLGGFIMGVTDVALNVDGTAIEARTGKTAMPRLHAGYSLGTLIGAAWGSVCAALQVNLFCMALPLCMVQIALPFVLQRFLPRATGKATAEAKASSKDRGWFRPSLALLGIGILCMTVAEGAAYDWLTLGIRGGYHAPAASAGLVFSVFFVGMVVTRFFGGLVADRVGKGNALKLMAAIGVVGVVLVAVGSPNIWLAGLGGFMWGIGVALGFPLFLSAAGGGEHSAKQVGFVASWGYGAFLSGPPLLGFVADHVGMLNMFFGISGFLVLALLVSGAAGSRKS